MVALRAVRRRTIAVVGVLATTGGGLAWLEPTSLRMGDSVSSRLSVFEW